MTKVCSLSILSVAPTCHSCGQYHPEDELQACWKRLHHLCDHQCKHSFCVSSSTCDAGFGIYLCCFSLFYCCCYSGWLVQVHFGHCLPIWEMSTFSEIVSSFCFHAKSDRLHGVAHYLSYPWVLLARQWNLLKKWCISWGGGLRIITGWHVVTESTEWVRFAWGRSAMPLEETTGPFAHLWDALSCSPMCDAQLLNNSKPWDSAAGWCFWKVPHKQD